MMTSLSSGTLRVFPTTICERDADDVGRVEGDHLVRFALEQQFDGVAAEARRQRAVEAGGRAAALQVTEDDAARLLAHQLFEFGGDLGSDAAEAFDVGAGRFLDQRALAVFRRGAFGRDDDAEAGAPLFAGLQPLRDRRRC